MVKFWLNNFQSLFDLNNFNLNDSTNNKDKQIKLLNIISLLIILFSLLFTLKTKKVFYFGIGIILLSIIILIYNNNYVSKSGFGDLTTDTIKPPTGNQAITYTNSIKLQETVGSTRADGSFREDGPPYYKLFVSSVLNINPGDIIQIADQITGSVSETNVVASVNTGLSGVDAYIQVKNKLKNTYQKDQTKILVVKSVVPQIETPPDPLLSIQQGKGYYNPNNSLFNGNIINNDQSNRTDAQLDRSVGNMYQFQGPPYGDLACRPPSIHNPMESINVTEFDNKPNMFGSCNVNMPGSKINEMFESGVSMRRDDLIYHRGNSQQNFYPVAIDTLPNQQDLFAAYCYQTPGNLVNPKYASIFVNDPKQFKLVSKLARATGTENGGGGGGLGSGIGGRTS